MFSWLPQKKKRQGSCSEVLCSVYARGVVSFGLNSEGNLPGAAHAERECSGCAGGAASAPTAHLT